MKDSIKLSNFKEGGHLHFIGCGGAGTQPLMKIFHDLGFSVSGSDMSASSATAALQKAGLKVSTGHSAENIPKDITPEHLLIVHSSAVAQDNPELSAATRLGCRCIRRGEALALLASSYNRVAAISGSHGKTTVSGMLAHILKACGAEPGYLVGGAVQGWDFNGAAGSGDIFVCEVDESDGTHSLMKAGIGIVTNVEDDHAWSVGGVERLIENFRSFGAAAAKLIYVGSDSADSLFSSHPDKLRLEWNALAAPGHFKSLPSRGAYQRVNAGTAIAAAEALGIPTDEAESALESFPGVDRRMSLRFKSASVKIIEDYAHHPTELSAALSSLRETHPDSSLTVVFQPHRYARLERYLEPFAMELSAKADRVFITPVFAAWTSSGKVDSGTLASRVGRKAKALSGSWDAMAEEIVASLPPSKSLLAVVGAGDLKDLIPHLIARFVAIGS